MSSTLRRLPLLVAARPRNGSRQAALAPWDRRSASSQLLSSPWPAIASFSANTSLPASVLLLQARVRFFNTTASRYSDGKYDERAKRLSQKSLDEHEQEVKVRKNQVKRPWHREGADKPPVDADGAENEPQSKGKLLTTPTRLLKLVLPLPLSAEKDKDNNGIEFGRSISPNDTIQPLALLVHPQQPLSYVERLIQAELPPVLEKGHEKVPNVYFRAEDASKEDSANENRDSSSKSGTHVASYSGLGHEGPSRAHKDKDWVRWSNSTEIGDFIRDAARGREFAVEIEGFGSEIRVGVPSFKDRTHYLSVRLRKMSRQVDRLSRIKNECDMLAHRAAHRLAKGGLAALATWWAWVYYVTFLTDYGWELVEPVTYLAGLATIMGGYLWFLYISRDLSYRSAMNITVSRRQTALYEARGFNVQKWDQLVQEANALRKEIKIIADEYDVEWDETRDLGGEDVKKVLEKEKKKRRTEAEEEEEDEEEEEEENKTEGKKGSGKEDDKV